MESSSTSESIHLGVVRRPVALGLAVLVTSLIFTSVPLVFSAGVQSLAGEVHLAGATFAPPAGT